MIIFQLDRHLLEKQIKDLSRFITGAVLDIGVGSFSRYKHLFTWEKYLTMDVKSGPGVDIVAGIEQIPLDDNLCDSVICTQVLEHVPNPFVAAKEIYRVLKSSGYCLITIPQTSEIHEEPNDFFRYTKFGIAKVFNEAGFETVRMEQRGGFFSTVTQEWFRYYINKFSLYRRPVLGRVANRLFHLFGRVAMLFDSIDCSEANRKHAIGWAVVFKKP